MRCVISICVWEVLYPSDTLNNQGVVWGVSFVHVYERCCTLLIHLWLSWVVGTAMVPFWYTLQICNFKFQVLIHFIEQVVQCTLIVHLIVKMTYCPLMPQKSVFTQSFTIHKMVPSPKVFLCNWRTLTKNRQFIPLLAKLNSHTSSYYKKFLIEGQACPTPAQSGSYNK